MTEAKALNTIGGHFKLYAVKDVSKCIYTDAVGSLMYAMVGTRPDLVYLLDWSSG